MSIEAQLQHLAAAYPDGRIDLTYKPKKKDESNKDSEKQKQDTKAEDKEAEEAKKMLDAEMLMFKFKDMQHYYVLLFDDDKIDAIDLERRIRAFNDANYADAKLSAASTLFTMTKQILSVKRFRSKEDAMDYYNNINKILKDYNQDQYTHFVISIQNYPTFYKNKNIETYEKFFKLMYLEPLQESDNVNKTKKK